MEKREVKYSSIPQKRYYQKTVIEGTSEPGASEHGWPGDHLLKGSKLFSVPKSCSSKFKNVEVLRWRNSHV